MFSALPPRADIAHCSRHVCFVPTGDILLALLTTELLATETAISRELSAIPVPQWSNDGDRDKLAQNIHCGAKENAATCLAYCIKEWSLTCAGLH
jgi:hypothetical protein